MSDGPGGKRILLVGAGHAHLHVISQAARFRRGGHRVTVVAPGAFWYSGLATGMVGGHYSPADDQVDVEALARRGGAEFLRDEVTACDTTGGWVELRSGRRLGYDLLSLNVGSAPPPIEGDAAPGCYRVKPIAGLARLVADLTERFASGRAVRVVVAGGGATGAELSANLLALAHRHGAGLDLTLVAGGGGFLKGLPPGAARRVEGCLAGRGATVLKGERIRRIADGRAELESGGALGFDLFLNAAGLRPAAVVAGTGLPVDEEGALRIDAHLQSIADPRVFGAGDCVALEGHRLPRIGVHAVRQAPVLLDNLLAAAGGGRLRSFRPQRTFLWILNLGDGTGLAVRGGLWWHGRAAFWLKDRIDRRFLQRYRGVAGD